MFMLVIKHALRRNGRVNEIANAEFWAREAKANNVRKKNIDNLPYLEVPFDELPMNVDSSSFSEENKKKLGEVFEAFDGLKGSRIINLTGFTNTDLKLEYGTANITPLSQYDQNYTVLARTLQKWAEILYDEGLINEALCILEYALSTNTDITKTYTLAADIYREKGEPEKIGELINRATELKTLSKNIILDKLKEDGE